MAILHRGVPRVWSVSVFLETPRGIIVVKDPRRNKPRKKFPGGKWELIKDGNSSRGCGKRELKEETGLVADRELVFVGKFDRTKKSTGEPLEWFLYYGYCDDFRGLLKYGDGGEEVSFLPYQLLNDPKIFLDDHWDGVEVSLQDGRFERAYRRYFSQPKNSLS